MQEIQMNDRIVKWGIIGTGNIANAFATALTVVENSSLLAIASRSIQKAKIFANKYDIDRYYGSYLELLKDEEIDIVYIATPHNLHFENTIQALEHNKAVLCEKPLAVNHNEAKLMIDLAQEKRLFLMEAMWSRFLPNIIKAKEIVDKGIIGKVKLLKASFAFKSPYGNEHRHFNIDLCGGTILDIGIYNVFLSLLILGKPNSVIATANLSDSGIDLSANYTFNYQDSISIMDSSFLVDAPIVSEIHGEKAKILLQHRWFSPGSIKLVTENGTEEVFDFNILINGYEFEAMEAVNCLLNNKIESEIWTHTNSLELINCLDQIRRKCGVKYPKHDLVSP